MSEKQYKQLSLKNREAIEDGLNVKMTASGIARNIGVSVATVTREVKRNRRDDGYRANTTTGFGNNNLCIHKATCDVRSLCLPCNNKKTKLCSKCATLACMKKCQQYEEQICSQLIHFPFTCNGCGSYCGCRMHRFRYSAKDAQAKHDSRSTDTRSGIDVSEDDLLKATDTIRAGLKNNQGLAHIYATHGQELPFSIRSCYRHIENGDIAILPMDLPKQTRYKLRSKHRGNVRDTIPETTLAGRRYSDFLALDESVRESVVEMDCVVGPKGSIDAILTLHFKALHFQIGIKLERKDTQHVVAALDALEEMCGQNEFNRLFGIILCDRGSEFHDAIGMEREGISKRCSIYYCDARRSDQKGSCEKNHVEVRKVIPKGTSLENIGQRELADVFSHVNSFKRQALFGVCPLELVQNVVPDSLLDNLGYRLIAPDDVLLSPRLLKDKNTLFATC